MANFVSPNQTLVLLVRPNTCDDTSQPWLQDFCLSEFTVKSGHLWIVIWSCNLYDLFGCNLLFAQEVLSTRAHVTYPLHSLMPNPTKHFRSLAVKHAYLFFLFPVFCDREDETHWLFAVLDRGGRLRFVPLLGMVLQRGALWVLNSKYGWLLTWWFGTVLLTLIWFVPQPAQFCLGRWKLDRDGMANGQTGGTPELKSTKSRPKPPWSPCSVHG